MLNIIFFFNPTSCQKSTTILVGLVVYIQLVSMCVLRKPNDRPEATPCRRNHQVCKFLAGSFCVATDIWPLKPASCTRSLNWFEFLSERLKKPIRKLTLRGYTRFTIDYKFRELLKYWFGIWNIDFVKISFIFNWDLNAKILIRSSLPSF